MLTDSQTLLARTAHHDEATTSAAFALPLRFDGGWRQAAGDELLPVSTAIATTSEPLL
jgi:hypothetical protein